VVDTFSLCVFPDPAAAIRSMAACLRPGGTLLLLEHSRSGFGALGWYQDVTAPAVAAMGKGCRWNDDVAALVKAAGLRVQRAQPHVGGLVISLSAVKPA
jgi:SAM-dependent methyltransferase